MFQKITTPALPLLKLALTHPFNIQLLQRKLPEAVFDIYLAQDLIYLEQLADLLPKISNRLILPQDKLIFNQFTEDTVQAEQKMRENFNIQRPTQISPIIKSYLNHLNYYADHIDLAVGISAFMPCFWLYKELGKLIDSKQIQDKNCKQSSWLNSYINPDFHTATDQAIQIMLNHIEENSISNMATVFKTSVKYELAFWNECYSVIPSGPIACSTTVIAAFPATLTSPGAFARG